MQIYLIFPISCSRWERLWRSRHNEKPSYGRYIFGIIHQVKVTLIVYPVNQRIVDSLIEAFGYLICCPYLDLICLVIQSGKTDFNQP